MTDNNDPLDWTIHNYCVSFIDLLGQRDAMRGQGLFKGFESAEQEQAFKSVIRNSVGTIYKLQKLAAELIEPALKPNPNSPRRAALPTELHAEWDEMQLTDVKTQRWSDGLVCFSSLGDVTIKCRMNSVYTIFALSGCLCFMGLATKRPLRGGIEVAWGVELHSGELSGPAVARAYELESEVAQYPRIVVGPEVVRYLEAHAAQLSQEPLSLYERDLANICLGMLASDPAEGYWILHYLGDKFQNLFTRENHSNFYTSARKFIVEQMEQHSGSGNVKLQTRYATLLSYFDENPPMEQSALTERLAW
jgi:hypothetical protein